MIELLTPETQKALVTSLNDLINLGVGVLSAWLAWRATKAKRDINAAHEKIRLIAKPEAAAAPPPNDGASLADLADVEPDVVDAMLARLELEVRALRIVRTLSRQPVPPPPPPADDHQEEHADEHAA